MRKIFPTYFAIIVFLFSQTVVAQIQLTERLIREEFGGACSLAGADFNDDGTIDFAITASDSGHVGWFQNDGQQHFIRHMITEDFSGARALDIADLDKDNDMDIIATAFNANKICWFENDGAGNFTEHVVCDNWTGASYVKTRNHLEGVDLDLDKDGDIDVLATACDGNVISWFENDGNQNFTERILKSNWTKANCATATDLDQDGDLDVIGTAKAGQIIWFENDGNMNFSENVVFSDWAAPNSVIAADIDNDTDIDFAATACGSDDKVGWFENDGNQDFTCHVLRENYNGARAINLGDIENDGDIDIIAIAWQGAIASIFENKGAQTFSEFVFCETAYDLLKTDVIDLDLDGDPDIIGACFGEDEIRWWENEMFGAHFDADPSTGHFPLTVQFTDNSVFALPITSRNWDFNNDGIVDSHAENPEWIYTEPGTYTVKLEVSTDSLEIFLIKENCVSVFDGESAIDFNTSGSLVSCPAIPELNLTGSFTLEAWIFPNAFGEREEIGLGRIFDKNKLAIFLVSSYPFYNDSCLAVELKHSNGTTSRISTPAGSITLHTWQHIAVTYNGDDNLMVYINGVEQDLWFFTPPSGNVSDNADDDLSIGKAAQINNTTFQGAIDEARVWNLIRNQNEIETNMDHYMTGNEIGLVGYWKMNEGDGDIIEDFSPQNNTGSITEAGWCQGKNLDSPVSIYDTENATFNPTAVNLHPNPFENSITINYTLFNNGIVEMAIYDTAGKQLGKLVEEYQTAGPYQVFWDGCSDSGTRVGSGVYLLKLQVGETSSLHKIVKIR